MIDTNNYLNEIIRDQAAWNRAARRRENPSPTLSLTEAPRALVRRGTAENVQSAAFATSLRALSVPKCDPLAPEVRWSKSTRPEASMDLLRAVLLKSIERKGHTLPMPPPPRAPPRGPSQLLNASGALPVARDLLLRQIISVERSNRKVIVATERANWQQLRCRHYAFVRDYVISEEYNQRKIIFRMALEGCRTLFQGFTEGFRRATGVSPQEYGRDWRLICQESKARQIVDRCESRERTYLGKVHRLIHLQMIEQLIERNSL